jgi:hypothetical protein
MKSRSCALRMLNCGCSLLNSRNIWSFNTPGEDAVRYYEYDVSRAQAVVKRFLNGQFAGHLVSDFYCGYTDYAGKHQRCWAHLLRDLHALKEAHPPDADFVR